MRRLNYRICICYNFDMEFQCTECHQIFIESDENLFNPGVTACPACGQEFSIEFDDFADEFYIEEI